MLNLFGVKITETMQPYYFYDSAEEALTWQLQRADIPFRIVKYGTPEWKTTKPAHKAPKEFQPLLNNQDIIFVPFAEKDFYYHILDKIYDKDYFEEANKRGLEDWIENFGPNLPLGQEPVYEDSESFFKNLTAEEKDQMLAKYTKSGKIEKRETLW